MAQSLTPRQQKALDKVLAGGTVDKGMLIALTRKGYLGAGINTTPPVSAPTSVPVESFQRKPKCGELEQACLDRIEQAFELCEAHYKTQLKRVPVKFSLSMTTTAGTAGFSRVGFTRLVATEIKLSTKLLHLNGQQFVDDTPGHEAAHIVAYQLFGEQGRGHGRRWKEVMAVIGQRAHRCHSMKTARVMYEYQASCGTSVQLNKSQHRRVSQGVVLVVRKTQGRILSSGYVREVNGG